nr:T9SS type A sorting domain-containing protein [uncultured Pedobacter sp.]
MLKKLQSNLRNASLGRGIKLSAIVIATATFCSSSVFAQDATYYGGNSSTFPPSASSTLVMQNTVPVGKNSVTIQMWGAGGNGGAASPNSKSGGYSAGGGGGGGAYTLITIPVVQGTVYNVTIGAAASIPETKMPGKDGFDSFVTESLSGTELGRAQGGRGGGFNETGAADGGLGGVTTGGITGSLTGNAGDDGIGGAGKTTTGGAGGAGVAPLDGETPTGGAANVFDPAKGNWGGAIGTGIGSGGGGGVSDISGTAGSTAGNKGGRGTEGRVIFTYSDAVLPVSLISFNAAASNNQAKLSWETASEANNNRFEVQRSSDNKTYTTVATITGNGTSSQKSSYTAYDANPQNGVNYYKLVQIDNDGTIKELAIKSVNFSFAKAASVSVYPNPASGVLNVNINAEKAQTAKATLTGSNGAVYLSQTLQLSTGANTATINLNSNIAPGQYVLTVVGADIQESIKVMIK